MPTGFFQLVKKIINLGNIVFNHIPKGIKMIAHKVINSNISDKANESISIIFYLFKLDRLKAEVFGETVFPRL